MLSIIICDDDQTINHQLLPIIQKYLEQKKIPAAIQQYTDAKKLLEDMPLFVSCFWTSWDARRKRNWSSKSISAAVQTGDRLSILPTMHSMPKRHILCIPFGYLTKPIDEESINKILEEALEYLEKKSPHHQFGVMTDTGIKHVAVEDIYYFETYERKIQNDL